MGDEMVVMVIATGFNAQPATNDFQINLNKPNPAEEPELQQSEPEKEVTEASEPETGKVQEPVSQEPEIEIPFFLQKRKKG